MESCKELRENNPYLFNSWRAILYTEKGRKAGVVNDWRKFPVFYEDVHKSYKNGLRLSRKDKNKPFGPDNFEVEMVINTKRHSELMNILDSSEWVNKEDYYDI